MKTFFIVRIILMVTFEYLRTTIRESCQFQMMINIPKPNITKLKPKPEKPEPHEVHKPVTQSDFEAMLGRVVKAKPTPRKK